MLDANAATKVFNEANGVVVMEAENFSDRTADPDGHHWHIVPQDDGTDSFGDTHPTDYSNARGSYLVSLPDGGANKNGSPAVVGTPA